MNNIKTTFPVVGFWDTRQGGRVENQDSCGFLDTPYGLLSVVCDGMGGGPAGKLASSLAVQKILDFFSKATEGMEAEEMVRLSIEEANNAIIETITYNRVLKGMGTTVVVALINQKSAVVAHVGDSRIYQFRHGSKVFRTIDHSWVSEMVQNGTLTEEQARLSSQSNIITRALGGKGELRIDMTNLSYEKGDRFLLCTDGIWGALSEKELVERAARTPSLPGSVDGIVLEVDERGRRNGNTHDNLTLAIIETKVNSIKKREMRKKDRLLILFLMVICSVLIMSNIYTVYNDSSKELESRLNQVLSENKRLIHLSDSMNILKNRNATLLKEKKDIQKEMEKIKKAADETYRKVKEKEDIIKKQSKK